MDGQFVDNISFGRNRRSLLRKETNLPLDVHLMIRRPYHYRPALSAGANSLRYVGGSRSRNFGKTLGVIRDAGFRTALSLNRNTFRIGGAFPCTIDILLVRTVHPCFGGQSFGPN